MNVGIDQYSGIRTKITTQEMGLFFWASLILRQAMIQTFIISWLHKYINFCGTDRTYFVSDQLQGRLISIGFPLRFGFGIQSIYQNDRYHFCYAKEFFILKTLNNAFIPPQYTRPLIIPKVITPMVNSCFGSHDKLSLIRPG